jgi:endonuclease YncB( thermonuclease family)
MAPHPSGLAALALAPLGCTGSVDTVYYPVSEYGAIGGIPIACFYNYDLTEALLKFSEWFGIFVLLLFLPVLTGAAEYTGKVVSVHDGDTIRVLYYDGELKIRLECIDAPELHQPYGKDSKETLSNLVFGRTVRVEDHGRDRYGRLLGRVYYRNLDVNSEMVREGAAWVFVRYCHDPEFYRTEREAREAKRGLWALPDSQRVAPWQWRHPHR